MKYSPSETRPLLSSSHSETSIRDENPKKAPSIRKKITKTLKKAGEAWYNEMESSADAGGKIGESIARKLTGTKNLPDTQISPTSKKIIKASKTIGEFVAAFKEVYPAVAKVPVNILKETSTQPEDLTIEKPKKRENILKATGRHFIENVSQGLELGEEIGRRVTGIKSGSIKKASASKELTVRAFQAAGFVAGYSLAISTALIGIPTRMLVPQNKTSDDYINPQDSDYKYTGLARRAKVGLLASDSISSIGDHEPSAHLQVPFQHSEYDEKETERLRKETIDKWDLEVASNSAHSTPAQSVVNFALSAQTIPPVPSLIYSDGQSSVQTSSYFSPSRPSGNFPPRIIPDDQTTTISFDDKKSPTYQPSDISTSSTQDRRATEGTPSEISGFSNQTIQKPRSFLK